MYWQGQLCGWELVTLFSDVLLTPGASLFVTVFSIQLFSYSATVEGQGVILNYFDDIITKSR